MKFSDWVYEIGMGYVNCIRSIFALCVNLIPVLMAVLLSSQAVCYPVIDTNFSLWVIPFLLIAFSLNLYWVPYYFFNFGGIDVTRMRDFEYDKFRAIAIGAMPSQVPSNYESWLTGFKLFLRTIIVGFTWAILLQSPLLIGGFLEIPAVALCVQVFWIPVFMHFAGRLVIADGVLTKMDHQNDAA